MQEVRNDERLVVMVDLSRRLCSLETRLLLLSHVTSRQHSLICTHAASCALGLKTAITQFLSPVDLISMFSKFICIVDIVFFMGI